MQEEEDEDARGTVNFNATGEYRNKRIVEEVEQDDEDDSECEPEVR